MHHGKRRLKGDEPMRSGRLYEITEKSELLSYYSRRIALKVEHLRKQKNLNQTALAAELELPQSTISALESGWANPRLLLLVKLSGFFGVSIGELFVSPFVQD